MSDPKNPTDLSALRAVALRNLEETTDAELRAEELEDGVDIEAQARVMREAIQSVIAAGRRQALQEAKERARIEASNRKAPGLVRPSVERIKKLIHEAFQSDPSLGLAFREGKRQTDHDWQTTYDDLIRIGAIKPSGEDD